MTSQLLINESPLQLLPSLAATIGLNEAIVLQQIQYWISGNQQRKSKHHFIDGRWWTYNTAEAWQEQFPFWSVSTVRRILASLKERGLIIAEKHGNNGFDHTLWYTIDYVALNDLPIMGKSDRPSDDNTDLANLDNSTYTETIITESTAESTPPPAKPKPRHIANMEARDELATLPQPIQELAQVVSDVTLQPINAKVIEVAYTLFGHDAEPDDVRRLFSGTGCYWLKAGAGSWDDGSPRPYPGNIASDWRRAVEWAETNTSGGELAKLYEAYIEPLKEKSGDELRASVLSLPSDIKTRLTELGVNQIGQIVRLSAAQFAGGG